VARDEFAAALLEIARRMPAGMGRAVEAACSWVEAYGYDPTPQEACRIAGNRDNAEVFLATIKQLRRLSGGGEDGEESGG